jgi:hypothetical protein
MVAEFRGGTVGKRVLYSSDHLTVQGSVLRLHLGLYLDYLLRGVLAGKGILVQVVGRFVRTFLASGDAYCAELRSKTMSLNQLGRLGLFLMAFGRFEQGVAQSLVPTTEVGCDVIIVGGSTAALAAALAAAKEFSSEGRGRVACLTEPTTWLGGQLTSSGVTAVDWAHHKTPWNNRTLNVSKLSRMVVNNPVEFSDLMKALAPDSGGVFEMKNNPGQCWVSVRCYQPQTILSKIDDRVGSLVRSGSLKVFLRSVPKSVSKKDGKILSVQLVQRTPLDLGADEERLSEVISDWYSLSDSTTFRKDSLTLVGRAGLSPVVLDASEWGEILVLSGASYLQGVEASEERPEETNATCGQAIVYPLALSWSTQKQPPPNWVSLFSPPNPEHYSLKDGGRTFTWQEVWAYRRIRYAGSSIWRSPSVFGVPGPVEGDISEQNWTFGNDYPYGYLFMEPSQAQAQIQNWAGGVDVSVLRAAEAHAVGWFGFMRNAAPQEAREKVIPVGILGTRYGFSKMPYIRDTRRSIGVGGFVMKYADGAEGFRYPDSIGVGAYVADVHETKTQGCSMPEHVKKATRNPKPFFLPLRAHTNRDVSNLLVAGKTMAQTFLMNAATRLHPIEFASGTGAGVAAAFLHEKQTTSEELINSTSDVSEIQKRIEASHGSVEWHSLDDALE